MPKKNLKPSKSLITYFLVACSGVAIQLLSGRFLRKILDFSYEKTVFISYFIALFATFFLARLAFTNKEHEKSKRELPIYFLISSIGGIVTWGGAILLYKFQLLMYWENVILKVPFSKITINFTEVSSHIGGMGLSFLFNYFGHKKITFKERKEKIIQ